jgi:hypothetical protein
LRHGVADQMQGRKGDESGKPCQRQSGSEDAAGNDQRLAPKSALLHAQVEAVR